MPSLLIEIGSEEMPARAIGPALAQFRDLVEERLTLARLAPESVVTCGTPRRLVALATGVPDRQPDEVREVRGPARSVAFNAEGAPTGAAIGFARKQGVAVTDLELVTTPQGEYVQARVMDAGRPAAEAAGAAIEEAVNRLSFPKLMLWGEGAMRYVRPIRWIVAVLGDQVVPVALAGVQSGRTSRGHRYLAPADFDVVSPEAFLGQLREACVMTDPEERRALIVEQANALAAEAGGTIPWDAELLEENVQLVEWPTCVLGSFADKYMELPRPVLVTAMKKHQRFFPVQGPDGNLLPRFVAVRNGGDRALDVVRAGYERVLEARFADALYFLAQDRDTALEDMVAGLGNLIFQEKLGTVADKRDRLMLLAPGLADAAGLGEAGVSVVAEAASLCKADLVSRMVVELPSLQGIIGREYARTRGIDPDIADAIAEHYLPKSAGDSLPKTRAGWVLAVADRMDTLVGYVGLGIVPSGSSDPYGLRRAAQGIVQILAEQPGAPGLASIASVASAAYVHTGKAQFDAQPLREGLQSIFEQRMAAYLSDRGVRHDLVAAALGGGSPANQVVYDLVTRADAISRVSEREDWVSTVQAGARVANILKSAPSVDSVPTSVDPALFADPAEVALFAAVSRAAEDAVRCAETAAHDELFGVLAKLTPAVTAFFDAVLVMAPEPEVRANRLGLLGALDAFYRRLADFTQVVIA